MRFEEKYLGYGFGILCTLLATSMAFTMFMADLYGTAGQIFVFAFAAVVSILLAKIVSLLKEATIYLREHSMVLKAIRNKIKDESV